MRPARVNDWTDAQIDAAIAELGRHASLDAACSAISAAIRPCNRDNLGHAFKHRRLAGRDIGTPSEYLARRSAPAAYTGAAPPDFEDVGPTAPFVRNDTEPAPFREERTLVVPDSHWPYVDEVAWAMLIRIGRFIQPHRIITLGDFLDCLAVSSHPKTAARRANLAEEIGASGRGLDDLDSLGAEEKHFLHGNHCFRMRRFVDQHAPALHGLVGLTIGEMLRLGERGWTESGYMKEHHLADWRMSHDYGDAGPYALKRAIEVTDSNTIIGHTHRLAEHVGTAKRDGRTIRGMSFGWLGSFDEIDYMHRAKARRDWAHGCGVGFSRPDGTVRFEAVRFAGAETRVDGQRVAA